MSWVSSLALLERPMPNIAAPFRDSQQRIVGVLGVIGPTRLNYARIVPMVDYTAKVVGKIVRSGV